MFEEIRQGIITDRLAFLSKFFMDFYNVDKLKDHRVSEEIVQFRWNIAYMASPKGTLDCVQAWLTDLRDNLKLIDIPSLIIHSNQDRIVHFLHSGNLMLEFFKRSKLVVVEGGPHNIGWNHAEEVNSELLDFLS